MFALLTLYSRVIVRSTADMRLRNADGEQMPQIVA
jgi:hypothetical protein